MSRLMLIAPVKINDEVYELGLEEAARPETSIDFVGFDRGTRHLEYHYYESLAVPDVVHSVLEAERLGYDVAVLGCFYDSALHESREVPTRIVVTAPCESSLLLAASLGSSFSI